MKRSYKPSRRRAKKAGEESFGVSEARFGRLACLAAVAKAEWPQNTAPQLAFAAGISVRRAEQILAGDGVLSGEALAALIFSAAGEPFFAALAAGSDAAWLRGVRAGITVRRIASRMNELQRALYPSDPALVETVLDRLRDGAVNPIELRDAAIHPSRQLLLLKEALAARALTRSFLDELAPCGGARR